MRAASESAGQGEGLHGLAAARQPVVAIPHAHVPFSALAQQLPLVASGKAARAASRACHDGGWTAAWRFPSIITSAECSARRSQVPCRWASAVTGFVLQVVAHVREDRPPRPSFCAVSMASSRLKCVEWGR